MKQAQVTLFFMLGLVILAGFAFAFYISSQMNNSELDEELDAILKERIKTTAVDEFVTLCLKEAAQEALVISGQQGGPIYWTQLPEGLYYQYNLADMGVAYGIPIVPFKVGDTTYNVSYGIRTPKQTIPPDSRWYQSYGAPPAYPYPGSLQRRPRSIPSAARPFASNAGSYKFIPLCMTNGSNAYDLGRQLSISGLDQTCEYAYGPNSIQYFLQEYVKNKTEECVKEGGITDILGYDVVYEKVIPRIAIGEDAIGFGISYPFRVRGKGKEPVTKFYDFYVKLPVRLKLIYFAARNLVFTDGYDIFFDMEKDWDKPQACLDHRTTASIDCVYDNMNVSIVRNVCNTYPDTCKNNYGEYKGLYSDIIILRDHKSNISGVPFDFQFARENRRPALDHINESPHHQWEYIVRERDKITIDPFGYDPDEDSEKESNGKQFMQNMYFYKGWQETCTSTFDFPTCQTKGIDWCINHVESLTSETCQTDLSLQPQKWSSSNLYQTEGQRKAEYTPTRNDAGAHNVEVWTCDPAGLCDFQNLRILVYDIPHARLKPKYGVVDPNNPKKYYISKEDPLILDASQSELYMGHITSFEWYEGTNFLGNAILVPPNTKPKTDYYITTEPNPRIMDIVNDPFFTTVQIGQTFTYSLVATSNSRPPHPPYRSSQDTITVEVVKCVPFGDQSNPIAPYNTGSDPFAGYHKCCLGDPNDPLTWRPATVAGNVKCFDGTQYGAYHQFKKRDPATTPSPNGNINDVYEAQAKRYCGGTRGNYCNGVTTNSVVKSSIICSYNPNLNEQCFGPDKRFAAGIQNAPNSWDCEAYTDTTYEKLFAGGSGNCMKPYCDSTTNRLIKSGTCNNGNCDPTFTDYEDCSSKTGCYNNNVLEGPTTCSSTPCHYEKWKCEIDACKKIHEETVSADDSDNDGWTKSCDANDNAFNQH